LFLERKKENGIAFDVQMMMLAYNRINCYNTRYLCGIPLPHYGLKCVALPEPGLQLGRRRFNIFDTDRVRAF
jgi:hypothetical protein